LQNRVLFLVVGERGTHEPDQPAELLASFANLMDGLMNVERLVIQLGERRVDLVDRNSPDTVLYGSVASL